LKKVKIFLVFLIVIIYNVHSESFIKVDKGFGLGTNCVYNFFEDNGKILFFTNIGIISWNGNRFEKLFRHSEIGSAEIIFSKKDSKNRIWFSTVNGLIYYLHGGNLFKVKNNIRSVYVLDGVIVSMLEDNNGDVFFQVFPGKVLKISDQYVSKEISMPAKEFITSDLIMEENGSITLYSAEKKYSLDKSCNKINLIRSFKNVFQGAKIRIFRIGINRLIFRKNDSLFVADDNLNIIYRTRSSLINLSGSKIIDNLLYVFDNKKIISYKLYRGFFKELSKTYINDVSSIQNSSDGSFLISSISGGFFIRKKIDQVNISPFGNQDPVISLSKVDDNNIIAGGYYGKSAVIKELNKFSILSNGEILYDYGLGRIFSAHKLKDQILFCSEQRGFIVDGDFKRSLLFPFGIRNFCEVNDSVLYSSSRDVHYTSHQNFDNIIIGYTTGKKKFLSSRKIDVTRTSLSPQIRPYSFCVSGRKVFIGSNKGIYLFSDSRVEKLRVNNYLNSDEVSDLVLLNDSIITFIKGSNSVYLYHIYQNKVVFKFSIDSTSIQRLRKFEDNNLWICSDNGLFKCHFQNGFKNYSLKKFQTSNGLLSNEVYDICFGFRKWWVATSKGISILDRNFHLVSIQAPPKPIFGSITINNNLLKSNVENIVEGVTQVVFSFGCLSFEHFNNLEFRYRLAPSFQWQISKNFDHQLINLSTGDYQIEVQARSPNSPWSASLFYPAFTVLPLFWERTWVILLTSGIFFSMLFALVYNVQRVRIARLRLDSEMTDSSLKALRSQMKPHFLSNILNSIQYFILNEKDEEAGTFINSFSRLVRNILDSSDTNYLSLSRELTQLEDYVSFECRRAGRDIAFEIELQPDADFSNVLIPTMLIQPLLENCLMHGILPKPASTDDKIVLSIHKVDSVRFRDFPGDKIKISNKGRLIVLVSDNGQGRTASMQRRHRRYSQSYGVKTIQERMVWIEKKFRVRTFMEIHDLADTDGNPCGTSVLLNLPLIISDFQTFEAYSV